jgi:hypothetical protein
MRRGWAAVFAIGACSPFSATPSEVDATRDGGAEAGAVDAGLVTDASSGDAGSFCANAVPAPTFCDDFDDRTDVQGKWVGVLNGGPLELATPSKSGAHALHSTSSNTKGTGLRKNVTVTNAFSIELDVMFRSALPSAEPKVGALDLKGPGGFELELYAGSTGAYVQLGGNDYSDTFTPVKSNVWYHVSIDVTNKTITAKIDDTPVYSAHTMPVALTAGQLTVEVGAPNPYMITGTSETSVDNVVIRAR